MPSAPAEKFVTKCPSCQSQMRVPVSGIGKRVRCPKCSLSFHLPSPEEESEGDGLPLDALATAEASGQAVSSPPRAAHVCPSCGAVHAGESSLCRVCTDSGAAKAGRAAVASKAAAPSAGGFGGLAGSIREGNLLFGILGSCIGAAVGGAIWFAVAKATQYEIGWIAWGVGALSGWGMVLGYKDTSFMAGVLAAVISGVGIVGAKFALFYMIFAGLFTLVPWDEEHSPPEQLAEYQAGMEMGDREFEDDEGEEAAFAAAVEKHLENVKQLPDAEVATKLADARTTFQREVQSAANKMFFSFSFGVIDILFFGLALFTAFKIGTGMAATQRE